MPCLSSVRPQNLYCYLTLSVILVTFHAEKNYYCLQVLNLFLALLLNAFGEDSTHDKNSAEAKRLKEARRRIRSMFRWFRNCCCRPEGVTLLIHHPNQGDQLQSKSAMRSWKFATTGNEVVGKHWHFWKKQSSQNDLTFRRDENKNTRVFVLKCPVDVTIDFRRRKKLSDDY